MEDIEELREQYIDGKNNLQIVGERLAKYLRIRDRLHRQQKKLCAAFSVLLRHISMYENIHIVVIYIECNCNV